MSGSPSVSVLLPAYCTERRHGSSRLRLALVSLGRQTLPADDYEVIVVDNGSEPPLATVVPTWDLPGPVRVLTLDRPGFARAYNAGLAAARAPLVLLGTDDEVFAPAALEAHVRHHRRAGRPEVGFGACRTMFHTEAFRDVTTAEVVPAVLARMRARPESSWLGPAMSALGLIDRPVTAADVRDHFDRLLALSATIPAFADIERVVGSGRAHRMRAGWLAMRVGNHTVPAGQLQAIGGADEELDRYGGWYVDIDLGLRLVGHGVAFGLVADALSTNLPHPRGDGYLLGAVAGMAYLIEKHRRMDVALSAIFFHRGFGIGSFSRILETVPVATPQDLALAAPGPAGDLAKGHPWTQRAPFPSSTCRPRWPSSARRSRSGSARSSTARRSSSASTATASRRSSAGTWMPTTRSGSATAPTRWSWRSGRSACGLATR